MPVKVDGLKATLQAMGKSRKKDGITIAAGLLGAAETLFRKSQELVPVDIGNLKESGRVWQYGVGMTAVAAVVYESPYAVPVHEVLDNYHAPPTQARYLADAIPRVRGSMVAKLQRQVRVGMSTK